MGLGLLRKASLYREKFLNRPKKGLLKRAQEYFETIKSNYPEIKENINLINDEISEELLSEKSLIEETDASIRDIDTIFDEKENFDSSIELEEIIKNEKESKEYSQKYSDLIEINPEELQKELIEDISKIEDMKDLEEEELEEVAELEDASILSSEICDTIPLENKEDNIELNEEKKEKNEEYNFSQNDQREEVEEIIELSSNEDLGEDKNEIKKEILEEIEKDNLNEVTKNLDSKIFSLDKDFNKRYYYNLINKVSKELAKLVISVDSYKDFLQIISNNFNISKCALLIFSPKQQKFVCWHVKDLDSESFEKLTFDLNFSTIYKNIAKEKSYLILSNNSEFENIGELLSRYDKNNSDFQLWVPFIFSARIIGILLLLQMYDRNIPSLDFMEALEIIGRLNGSLLYNLLQHYNLNLQKKNYQEHGSIDLEEINEDQKKDIDLEIVNKINNNNKINIDIENISLDEIFPKQYHNLVYFLEQKLKENSNIFISFISIKLTNKNDIEKNIPNFKASTFLSDIQFIGMNVVGTNSFLQVYEDISMFIILPEVKKSVAINTAKLIIDEIQMMFNEIFGNLSLNFKNLVLSLPEDSNNYIDILNKLINL